MDSAIAAASFEVKEDAQNIESRVAFEVEQNEEDFGLGAVQPSFSPYDSSSFTWL